MALHAAHLVRTAHVRHIDGLEASIRSESLYLFDRQIRDVGLSEARSAREKRGEAKRAINLREVNDDLTRQVKCGLHVIAREGLQINIRRDEDDVAQPVATLQRFVIKLRSACAQTIER